MRANVKKVINAFQQGKAAIGDSKRTIWTDGQTVYSYALPIAWRRPARSGYRVVEVRESGPSNTTRSQIQALKLTFCTDDYKKKREQRATNRRSSRPATRVCLIPG